MSSSGSDIFPAEDTDEYLIALGRITQGYRAMDTKLVGVAIKYFNLEVIQGQVIFAQGDPKRKMVTIQRWLSEIYRDESAPAVKAWKDVSKVIVNLVNERNNIVHSVEMQRKGAEIEFLRLSSTKPSFKQDHYQFHTGFPCYTPESITEVARKMYHVCDQLTDALRTYQNNPP